MKKIILIGFLLIGLGAMGQYQEIENLETGLSVRTKMNTMFEQLYSNATTIQFSSDGTSWHDTYAATDNYFRVSKDMGVTWGTGIPLTSGFKVQFSANDTIYSDSYTAGDTYYRFSTDGGTVWTVGIAMDASGFVLTADSTVAYVTPKQLDDEIAAVSAGNDNQKIDTLQLSGNTLQLSLERDAEPVKTLDLERFHNVDSVYVQRDSLFNKETLFYTKNNTSYAITELSKKDGIEDGGLVSWIDSLNFAITPAWYRIAGEDYESGSETVELDAADATNSRIDVIALDTLGQAVVIKGTAATNPIKPQIDPVAHVELTQVLLLANATEPSTVDGDTLTHVVVYDENTEWMGTASGMLADFAATVDPYSGTVHTEVTSVSNGEYIQYKTDAPVDVSLLEGFNAYIYLKDLLGRKDNIYVQLFLNDNPVSDMVSLLPDRTTTAAYMLTSIDMNAFRATSSTIDAIRITYSTNTGTHSGFYLDNVFLQGGIEQPVTGDQLITGVTYVSDTLTITEAGVEHKVEITASGGSSELTLTGEVTGTGTGTVSTTVSDNTIDYANVDETLKDSLVNNTLTWDISASGIIYCTPSTGTVSFTNKQKNKNVVVVLTLSSATITWPTEAKILDGSATLGDGTFYVFIQCISDTIVLVSITKEAA